MWVFTIELGFWRLGISCKDQINENFHNSYGGGEVEIEKENSVLYLTLAHLTPIAHRLLKVEILPSTTPIYNLSTNWVNGSGHKKWFWVTLP